MARAETNLEGAANGGSVTAATATFVEAVAEATVVAFSSVSPPPPLPPPPPPMQSSRHSLYHRCFTSVVHPEAGVTTRARHTGHACDRYFVWVLVSVSAERSRNSSQYGGSMPAGSRVIYRTGVGMPRCPSNVEWGGLYVVSFVFMHTLRSSAQILLHVLSNLHPWTQPRFRAAGARACVRDD